MIKRLNNPSHCRYLPWPHEALLTVAQRFISLLEGVSNEHKQSLTSMCPFVHAQV